MISEADADAGKSRNAQTATSRLLTLVFSASKLRGLNEGLETGRCPQMPLVGLGFNDLADLRDRVAKLVVGGEVVRSEPQPGVRTEVAEDLTLGKFLVHRLELGRAHRHGAAAAGRVARAADIEAGVIEQGDEQLRLARRVLADAVDADLFDQVVARGRRV